MAATPPPGGAVSGRGFGTDAFRDIDELIERWEIHRDDAD